MKKRRNLHIFNLSMDETNVLLAHSQEWASEFQEYFEKVHVWTMEISDKTQSTKVMQVNKLKTRFPLKMGTVLNCLCWIIIAFKERKYCSVFFHMNHKPVVILGPILKLLKIPSGMWYAHQKSSLSLRVASVFIDTIFTPDQSSFPFDSKKLKVMGHGLSKDFLTDSINANRLNSLVHVGRIARVKRIENAIVALSGLPPELRSLALIGKVTDFEYKHFLDRLANEYFVKLEYYGEVRRRDLPKILSRYSVLFSGTRGSIDKAPLEAASLGCFVISDNNALMKLSGMCEIYSKFREINDNIGSLEESLELCLQNKKFNTFENRVALSKTVRANNNLNKLIELIALSLSEDRLPL